MNQSSQQNQEKTRIAFIQARWHADIVDQCTVAFIQNIEALTGGSTAVDVFDVPGAFEIPLQAKLLACTGRYAAVVGSAFVVDGGIYRHDFVADTVLAGMMQAQMATDVPVLSAVLTPHQFQDTEDHRQFFTEHFKIKGKEAAEACIAVLNTRDQMLAAA